MDKFGIEHVPVDLYVAYKYLVAALLFIVISKVSFRKHIRPFTGGLIVKVLLNNAALLLYFIGLGMISGLNVAVLLALGPIFLFVASIKVLHEKLRTQILLGLVSAFVGVLIMIFANTQAETGSNIALGNALIIGSILFDTLSTLYSKRLLRRNINPDALAVFGLSAVAFMYLLIALVKSELHLTADIELIGWVTVVLSGVVFTMLPWVMFNRAYKHIDAEEVSVFIYIIPVMGSLASILVLGDSLTPLIIAGSMMVMFGLWLSQHKIKIYHPHFHGPHGIFTKLSHTKK